MKTGNELLRVRDHEERSESSSSLESLKYSNFQTQCVGAVLLKPKALLPQLPSSKMSTYMNKTSVAAQETLTVLCDNHLDENLESVLFLG